MGFPGDFRLHQTPSAKHGPRAGNGSQKPIVKTASISQTPAVLRAGQTRNKCQLNFFRLYDLGSFLRLLNAIASGIQFAKRTDLPCLHDPL